MSWDDFKDKPAKEEKLYTEPTYRSIGSLPMYSIFRIGRKHLALNTIRGFENYTLRKMEVPSANPNIKNEIIIGNEHPYADAKKYLRKNSKKGARRRKNSVLARDLLLTASPQFFKGISKDDFEKWKAINKQWLIDNFGENCISAILHLDQSTPHIHALIIPKFWSDKKQCYILSNTRYFNGRERLRGWQDNYASAMQERFKSLSRGTRYSNMKHMDIKKWRTLVQEPIKENDMDQIIAKAKNSELLNIQLKAVQKTLDTYKNHVSRTGLENEQLKGNVKELDKENKYYKNVVNILSKHYRINEKQLDNLVKSAGNERTR